MASNHSFPPEIVDDLMSLQREFESNSLITSLDRQRDVPMREKKVRGLLQEFDRRIRGSTLEDDFLSLRYLFAVMQCDMSVTREAFDEALKKDSAGPGRDGGKGERAYQEMPIRSMGIYRSP